MNLRNLLPLAGATLVLSACGGGGSGSTPQSTQSQSQGAYGTLTFATSQATTASAVRKPRYVSPSTTHATLFIDGSENNRVTCTSGGGTTGTCTIAWTSTSGSHTFAAEVDDGTYVLSAGTAQYVLVGGSNTLSSLTLNGVAANAVFAALPTCTTNSPNDCQGTFSIVDADADPIVSPGSYDNGPITVVHPSIGFWSSLSEILNPGTSTTISYTAACNASTNGTFSPQLTPTTQLGSSLTSGEETYLQGIGLTYPSPNNPSTYFGGSTGTNYGLTFTCTNGTISVVATGNLTVNGAARK